MSSNTTTTPLYTVPLLINGKEIVTSTTFPVISPSSHSEIWHSSSASVSDAHSACTAASAAFPAWSKTKPAFRRTILLKAADILEKRAQECGEFMMLETGAEQGFAGGFNVPLAVEMLRDVAGRISEVLGGTVPVCAEEGTSAFVLKEPFGVVLGIAPWNAPYILGTRAFLYPLAAGNTIILKGSELSPRCFHALGAALTSAGLPPGVLNILYHRPADAAEVTTALIQHPAVKKINFTGSTAVGRIVASTAGKALKPVLLELGGKASAVVLDDADIERAAVACAVGGFLHGGQICMATERIVVQSAILEEFVKAFQAKVKEMFHTDNPAPVLITAAGVEKNKKLVGDAVGKGAKVLLGNHETEERHPETGKVSGTRMRPVVVGGVTRSMDVYHEESFGPSISVVEVASEEEAVNVANDTEYGLSGAVFTKDLARGLRVARRIESGAIHINAMTVHDETNLPHGGVKSSGWGRFNGSWGLDEFLRLKTITFQE